MNNGTVSNTLYELKGRQSDTSTNFYLISILNYLFNTTLSVDNKLHNREQQCFIELL